jgi:ParB-like chromosome segregation protein Spo0J
MSKEDKQKLDAGAKDIRTAKKTAWDERQAKLQAEHAKELLEAKKVAAKAAKAHKATEAVKIDGMLVHPLAQEFPVLSDKEYQELREDIAANGIKLPLLVNEKMDTILDGRNRYMIAKELDFPVDRIPMEAFAGRDEDIAKEIISRNIMRRHLDEDQRVAIVTKLRAPQLEAEAAARMATSKKGTSGEGVVEVKGSVAEQLAEETNASQYKTQQALKARKAELLDDVIVGKRTLKAASDKVETKHRTPKVKPFEDVVFVAYTKFMAQFTLDQHREVRRILRTLLDPVEVK